VDHERWEALGGIFSGPEGRAVSPQAGYRLGKRLPTEEVASVHASEHSLMPAGWGEVMSNQYLADLISYLQSPQGL